MKTALVLGAGGMIGSHLVTRLKKDGYWVRGVDLKYPEFRETDADDFVIGDLRDQNLVTVVMGDRHFDFVAQLAADMGGALFVFTGEHDADILHNSALINLNVAHTATKFSPGVLFYSSSACVYPMEVQEDTDNIGLKEHQAYPVHPDSCYGYEKIFSEIVYDAFARNKALNVRIGRFHNVFGEYGTIDWLRAKAPASICRKVAESYESIEILGDGLQTRSFLYIDEAIEAVIRLCDSDCTDVVNIGSSECISINDFAKMVIDISGKDLRITHIDSTALGVRGRNSDNTLIEEVLGWKPARPLREGIEKLYKWVEAQVNGNI